VTGEINFIMLPIPVKLLHGIPSAWNEVNDTANHAQII